MADATVAPHSSDVRGHLFLRRLIRLSPVSNSVQYDRGNPVKPITLQKVVNFIDE